ncbi:hypothetical protein AOLI_G00256160 [Acnodon oligacanthus]
MMIGKQCVFTLPAPFSSSAATQSRLCLEALLLSRFSSSPCSEPIRAQESECVDSNRRGLKDCSSGPRMLADACAPDEPPCMTCVDKSAIQQPPQLRH